MLPYAEMYMNITPSSSTGKSPHEVVYGRQPINPFATVLAQPDIPTPAVTDFAATRQELWRTVHTAIEQAKQDYKR